jgi:hypothetical protein
MGEVVGLGLTQSRMSLSSLRILDLGPGPAFPSTNVPATLIATGRLSIDFCCIGVRAGRRAAQEAIPIGSRDPHHHHRRSIPGYCRDLLLGSVAVEPQRPLMAPCISGSITTFVAKLKALREQGENYTDVIIRAAIEPPQWRKEAGVYFREN